MVDDVIRKPAGAVDALGLIGNTCHLFHCPTMHYRRRSRTILKHGGPQPTRVIRVPFSGLDPKPQQSVLDPYMPAYRFRAPRCANTPINGPVDAEAADCGCFGKNAPESAPADRGSRIRFIDPDAIRPIRRSLDAER